MLAIPFRVNWKNPSSSSRYQLCYCASYSSQGNSVCVPRDVATHICLTRWTVEACPRPCQSPADFTMQVRTDVYE